MPPKVNPKAKAAAVSKPKGLLSRYSAKKLTPKEIEATVGALVGIKHFIAAGMLNKLDEWFAQQGEKAGGEFKAKASVFHAEFSKVMRALADTSKVTVEGLRDQFYRAFMGESMPSARPDTPIPGLGAKPEGGVLLHKTPSSLDLMGEELVSHGRPDAAAALVKRKEAERAKVDRRMIEFLQAYPQLGRFLRAKLPVIQEAGGSFKQDVRRETLALRAELAAKRKREPNSDSDTDLDSDDSEKSTQPLESQSRDEPVESEDGGVEAPPENDAGSAENGREAKRLCMGGPHSAFRSSSLSPTKAGAGAPPAMPPGP
jgi:hypothetical protein